MTEPAQRLTKEQRDHLRKHFEAWKGVWGTRPQGLALDMLDDYERLLGLEDAGKGEPLSRETGLTGEACKRCCRPSCVGFSVSDEAWAAVVRGRWNVLCTTCFDEEAKAAGIPYEFAALHPVTWSMWAGVPVPERQTTAEPLPDFNAPCPHPERAGKHEVYSRGGDEMFCRACGAESDAKRNQP